LFVSRTPWADMTGLENILLMWHQWYYVPVCIKQYLPFWKTLVHYSPFFLVAFWIWNKQIIIGGHRHLKN
jgi:hypothetical protein